VNCEAEREDDGLLLSLDGYQGPIDVLLDLARRQEVDLVRISVLQLADQYLTFMAASPDLQRSADYLVMAAWLVWLKSRLLLPEEEEDEPVSAEEMAEVLRLRLRRLEAMQQAGQRLMDLPRLGRDRLARGMTDEVADVARTRHLATLRDLLRAYANRRMRQQDATLSIAPPRLHSVRDSATLLRRILGVSTRWHRLFDMVPAGVGGGLEVRSAIASLFAASLQLVGDGEVELRQDRPFGEIELRGTGRREEET